MAIINYQNTMINSLNLKHIATFDIMIEHQYKLSPKCPDVAAQFEID